MVIMGEGLKRTSALDSALIFLLGPILMFIFSIEILKERFNAKILLGLLVALAGTALVVLNPVIYSNQPQAGSGTITGNLILVISVVLGVLGTIVVKPSLKKVPPIQVTTIRFVVTTLFLLPFAYVQLPELQGVNWSSDVIWSIAYSVLLGSVFAYTIYHWALGKISGEQSSVLHYLDPLGGVLGAIFILGDTLTPVILLGGSLAVVGIVLSEFKPKLRIHHLHAHR